MTSIDTREKYKRTIISFRFLFFVLGLLLTNFCTKEVTSLPAPFDAPVIIIAVLTIYQVLAAFITSRFIMEKLILFIVIAADIAFGIFLTFFFGAGFFAMAVIFPVIEVLVFLGVLMTLVIGVILVIVYFPLLGHIWGILHDRQNEPFMADFQAQIRIYLFMLLIILVFFYRLFKTERVIEGKEKEALRATESAEKETRDIKQQVKELCNELSHKQDAVQRLNFDLQNKSRELKEAEERLNEIMYQGQELLSMAQAKEEKSVEELKKQSGKVKHRLEYLESRVGSLTKLINVFQRLNISAHMDETYSNIMKMLAEVMPSQTMAVFILKPVDKNMKLSCEAVASPYKTYFEGTSYEPGQGIAGWAAKNKRTVVVSDGSIDMGGQEIATLIGYEKSAIVVPLLYEDNILGVIYLGRAEVDGFSQEDIEKVNLFVKLLSVALKFVKEYHMDISSGIKDNMTDLYTSYYFKERLKDEFERSKRYNYNTTLIVLELNNFDRIRSKYNALIVNSVLKEVGDLLISHCRAGDVIGRLGAEEFAILLIHTDKNEAMLIAERLRMAVGVRIFARAFGEKINTQAGMGLAFYNPSFISSDQFLSAALEAFARAKEKGGNTTVIY
ncbi:MAG: diguanylate cyclase [Armatimonadota bacterium]